MSRRNPLRAAGVAGTALPPLAAGDARADTRAAVERAAGTPAAATYDPQQRFIQVVGGGNGVLYGIRADGALVWYRHSDWQALKTGWASGSGRIIGNGFHQFLNVFGSADGSLYCLRADGTLRRYRYVCSDLETGAGSWADASGVQIGSGFHRYPRLFGFTGYVYGVTADGDVYAYRFNPATGTWTDAYGTHVGNVITFNGALATDSAASTILRNVFALALRDG
ncbi:tachylectin-related carbohydrate-binding protein [Micromonospora sp. B11E3]|uniref:tachylectin-related carbohydrate-binding protein n=1 Tax=Micromonospora sp. B11E3 TaxID=3153562 RepID=UPI00325EC669